MTNFKVFFNNWDNTANCTANGKSVIPMDMWEDWLLNIEKDGWRIQESKMWQAIKPQTPAKSKKAHNFTFEITGVGEGINLLAKAQEAPFASRFPTQKEILFREWFLHLCAEKFRITQKS